MSSAASKAGKLSATADMSVSMDGRDRHLRADAAPEDARSGLSSSCSRSTPYAPSCAWDSS